MEQRESGSPRHAPHGGGFLAEAATIGGQAGADLAGVDWSATPLGPPSAWPAALRGVLRTLLSSRFPMWLTWGPDLTFYCNDAYRRMTLAEKYPWALGRPAEQVWSEIWPDIGPRIDSVLRTGQATYDEGLLLFLQRSGYQEETYHTFSYGPAYDDDGAVAGMLCVVIEETDRVIAERRIELLQSLKTPPAAAQSEAELLGHLRRQLAADQRVLPFSLIYLAETSSLAQDPPTLPMSAQNAPHPGMLHLAAASGIALDHPAAPPALQPGPGAPWPVAAVADGAHLVTDLATRFPDLPTGAWNVPPTTAVVAPLTSRGGEPAAGVFIAGLNPYRPPDAGLVAFIDLVAGQVGTALAAARAYDSEHRRAEALAELDAAKTHFFTNLSHEFRTPLTLMLGPVQDALADKTDPLSPDQRRRIELIEANARRLGGLVDDLLDFTSIQEGRIAACYEPVDLGRFTAELAATFRSAFERVGLDLQVDCPRLAATTMGSPMLVDRDMWAKIVRNLLSNALKYTFTGSVTIRLAAEDGDEAAPEGRVRLTVSDTGVGIPEADQPHLFDRFHRVRGVRARNHEGSGIGLALVAELATLHGGDVAVSSAVGSGTTMTVRIARGSSHLPVEQVRVDCDAPDEPEISAADADAYARDLLAQATGWLRRGAADRPPTGAASPAAPPGERGGRVLVVDDHPDMREYVSGLLAPALEVSTAADGREALDAARADPPDLVLTDVKMPGLDGFEFLRELRADPRTALIPVIMLSARAGQHAAVEALAVGADDYLIKPFGTADLLARVHANLQLARARSHEAAWRRALVASIQDALVVLDDAKMIIEVNEAFRDLVGLPLAELPLAPPYPWWSSDEADRPALRRLREAWRRALAGANEQVTVPLLHADGRRLWVEVVFGPVREPRRDRRLVVATVRDVTARVTAAARQDSITRLTTRLAKLEDIPALLREGGAEIAAALNAAAVTVAVLDGAGRLRSPDPDGPAPEPEAAPTLIRVAETNERALEGAADGLVRACTAPVHAGDLRAAVRVAFDPPQRLAAADQDHVLNLCQVIAHAVQRTRAYDIARRVALTLQRSLLGPADLPPGFAVRYSPAVLPLEVGGDWYDVIELAEDCIGVVVGDCVGKGLDAATVMGQLRSACRALLLEANGPADVLAALDHFAARTPHAACTTVFCAVLDQRTGLLTYASAGHPPGILVHPDGRSELLDRGGSVPLASVANPSRGQAIARLDLGSMLALYTDGLVERRGEHLDEGIGRLTDVLHQEAPAGDEDLADRVLRIAMPADGQQDDVALLLYRHRNPMPFSTELTIDPGALAPMRRSLRHWLTEAGTPAADIDAVLVATGEACANSFEHGYGLGDNGNGNTPRQVELSATIVAGQLEVIVRDHGTWREPRRTENRGRGGSIMRSLMDFASIEGGTEGTVVRLRKELGRATA